MDIIQMKHEYEKFTLDISDITLRENKIIGLVGNNGAGKSTLMLLLSGYMEANWQMRCSEDYNVDELVFIPSTLKLYDYLSVEEFLRLAVSQAERDITVEALLEKLRLVNQRHTRISDLSQGMRKKLTLVNMFTKEYKLLILDEPFNSIDMQYVHELKEALREISRTATILVSSHILDTLSNLCDEFIYIKDGVIEKHFVNDDKAALERELFE